MPRPLCPRCSREYVRRVRRVGLGERLISLFYVYPFRCQLCGHRFQIFQWGVKYRRIEEDRREYERMTVNFPATFALPGANGRGVVSDISIAGCSFDTEAKLSEGNIVSLELEVANETYPVRVEAAVVRSVRSGRAGVEFLQFESRERERLQRFIRGLILDRWS